MSFIFGIGVLIWIVGFIKYVIDSLLGNIPEISKIYFFDQDILKPLGYSYKDYHMFCVESNTLDIILKVQKQLEKVANERCLDYCYLSILSDLYKNRELEQVCRNQLPK